MKTLSSIAVTLVVAAVFTFIVVFFAALGGLIMLGIWNLGVVPIVAACGGSVGSIGFWPAFFVSLLFSAIRQTFTK